MSGGIGSSCNPSVTATSPPAVQRSLNECTLVRAARGFVLRKWP